MFKIAHFTFYEFCHNGKCIANMTHAQDSVLITSTALLPDTSSFQEVSCRWEQRHQLAALLQVQVGGKWLLYAG